MLKEIGRNNRLVMLALFTWALGEGLWYNSFRQLYLVELGASEVQVGMALAIEAIVRALMPLPAGYLGDRFGVRQVMIAAWFVGMGGPVIAALAHTWQVAVPGLVLYALSGFAMPALSVYILRNVPGSAAPGLSDRVLTTVFSVYPAGLILSPIIGGQIADAYGIRATLWISSIIFVISTVAILFCGPVPAHRPKENERRSDLLRNRDFIRLMAFILAMNIGLIISLPLIPNFLYDVRGYSYSQIGVLFSVSAVGTVAINLLGGRASPRWNLVAVVGIYWLSLLGLWKSAVPAVVMVAFFGRGAIFVVRTLTVARLASVVEPHAQGLAFGALETMVSIAMAIAAWAAGWLYALTPRHDMPFIVSLVLIPPLVAVWLRLWGAIARRRQAPDTAQAAAAAGLELAGRD
jgi:DHA1 family multidrug resistance protein-like MFS transporter